MARLATPARAAERLHRSAAGLAGARRPGATALPRRRHPRQPAHAAVPPLHRPRRGRLQVGRGRPPVHRLLDGPRRAAARPQPARRPRRRAGAGAPGHALRRLSRQGGGVGRVGLPPRALRRAGALHRLRHRGHAHGAAPGARLHRASGTWSSSRGTSTAGTRASRSACGRRTTAEPEAGQLPEVVDAVTVLPPNDLAAVRERARRGRRGRGDHRAHRRPLRLGADAPAFLAALREETPARARC